jgi:hypothetical protein
MWRELWTRLDTLARIGAALAGTIGPALLVSAALAAHLPIAADLRFAIGFFVFVPVWVAMMTLTFLVRRGWVAGLACVIVTALLALAVPEAARWPTIP